MKILLEADGSLPTSSEITAGAVEEVVVWVLEVGAREPELPPLLRLVFPFQRQSISVVQSFSLAHGAVGQ